MTFRKFYAGRLDELTADDIKEENVITDLYIEYSNNFTNTKKQYYIEVELDSTGDIAEKLQKYEGLFWLRKVQEKPDGGLCVIYKNRRTLGKIEAYAGELPVKALHLSEVGNWIW